MNRITAIAIAMLFISTSALAQDTEFQPKEWGGGKMTLKKGTMQLGGFLSLDIDMLMPDEGDSITGFTLDVSPAIGYFVSDGFMVEGNFGVQLRGGDLYDNADLPLWFNVGGRYYIVGGGSVIPYFGARVGLRFDMPDEGDTHKTLMLGAPLGILWPLNQWVALDLGVIISFNMSLEDGGGSWLFIPIGFLGVEAFF